MSCFYNILLFVSFVILVFLMSGCIIWSYNSTSYELSKRSEPSQSDLYGYGIINSSGFVENVPIGI